MIGLEEIGEFCSNFDGVINYDIAEKLKSGGCASYPAYNWFGVVWYCDKQYHCAIQQFGVDKETISGDTPEELQEKCCEAYGYE